MQVQERINLIALLSILVIYLFGFNNAVAQSKNQLGEWESIPMPTDIKQRMQAVHVALLPNGKVLIVNGSSNRNSLTRSGKRNFGVNVTDYDVINNTSIFDPATKTFQKIPSPPIPRENQGQVLSGDLFCSGQAHLPNGNVLFSGGTKFYYPGGHFNGRRTSSIFDWQATESANYWKTVPDMKDGHWYPTLLRLSNGQIAVTSGISENDKNSNSKYIEFYDYRSNQWSHINMEKINNSPLNTLLPNNKGYDYLHHYPRIFPTPDGRIFFSHDGAGMGNMFSKKTYFLQLEFLKKNQAPNAIFTYGPERLVTNKVYSGGIIDPNADGYDILLSGGQIYLPGISNGPSAYHTPGAEVVRSFERFKLDEMKWQYDQQFLGETENDNRIMHNMIVLPNKQILIINGGNYAYHRPLYKPLLLSADPSKESAYRVETMASGIQPRLYHNTALLLPDASILVTGGNATRAIRKANGEIILNVVAKPDGVWGPAEPGLAFITAEIWQAEIYKPPYLFIDEKRPVITSAPEKIVYAASGELKVENAQEHASIALISLTALTHGFDANQRFADLKVLEKRGDSLKFKAPSNPHLYPPGYYMLFVVNPSGYPSISKILQLVNS